MLLSSARDLEREQLYQLLQKAEQCYCLKDRKGQYEFGKALALFSSPFDLIGDYYQSVYLHKSGQKQRAIEKLERVRQEVKGIYADKAILTLSGIREVDHDLDESLKLRLDLAKSEFLPIVVESAIGVAALLSSQGEHQKALENIERVLPLLSKLGPRPLYFDVLNSYATELAEIGKIELASEVITPVILSPYTSSYLNWLDTAEEIREKSARKSYVTFNRSNVIPFPTREAEEPEESEETKETEPEQPRFPYHTFITEKFGLEDKVEDWVHGSTEPDDLGALLLAISESGDRIERDMILEKTIDYTFTHTPESKEAKERWRDKVISKIKDET
jgi:tetratricopeptide (TPR) repeat protein